MKIKNILKYKAALIGSSVIGILYILIATSNQFQGIGVYSMPLWMKLLFLPNAAIGLFDFYQIGVFGLFLLNLIWGAILGMLIQYGWRKFKKK